MIMAGATTMLIGTAILTSSTTRAQLYVGRIVTGIVSYMFERICASAEISTREMVLTRLRFQSTNLRHVVVPFVVL